MSALTATVRDSLGHFDRPLEAERLVAGDREFVRGGRLIGDADRVSREREVTPAGEPG